MKIGCICVTEGRAPIWGIALASFITQTYKNAVLHVLTDDVKAYAGALDRLAGFGPTHGDVSCVGTGVHGKLDRMHAVMIRRRPKETLGKVGVPTALDIGIADPDVAFRQCVELADRQVFGEPLLELLR